MVKLDIYRDQLLVVLGGATASFLLHTTIHSQIRRNTLLRTYKRVYDCLLQSSMDQSS